MINGLSLFANVGIAETYLREVGVNIVLANELLEERAEFYRYLYPECEMVKGDITEQNIYDYIIQRGKKLNIEFILATPPCQGMSLAGAKDANDPRNYLVISAVEAVKELKPKFVMFENVTMQLQTTIRFEGKDILIPDYIQNELGDIYNFNSEKIVDTKFYGVPQQRKRAIAGCWVHCCRRFDEALKLIPKSYQKESNAFLLMKQIQAIYREEGKLNDLSSEERLKQRQAVIKPLVDAFFAYLKTITVSQKDKFGDAVGYALNQEKYLRVFLTDGDVPIDNNASERAIRGFCIGKKNWQMIDTIHGAKSSAIIYSIAETAKANNLKPFDYVQYLLEEIPRHTDEKDCSFLENLLPWSRKLPAEIRKA